MTHQAHPNAVGEAVQLLAEQGFDGMAPGKGTGTGPGQWLAGRQLGHPALEEFGADYVTIRGTWEERRRRAIEAIERYAAR